MNEYTCPCCGYLVFNEPPGSYEICPICNWEDDISQLRFPSTLGANAISLVETQKIFLDVGIKNLKVNHKRDDSWRVIDESRDNIEVPDPSKDYGLSYPEDRTRLYYWRRTQS